MDAGKDLSVLGGQIVADIGKEAVKAAGTIVGSTTNTVLKALLQKFLNDNPNLKPGKSNLWKLLNTGKPLKIDEIKAENLKFFSPLAKKFGITFAVVKENGHRHLVYKEEDAKRVQKVMDLAMQRKKEFEERQKQKLAKKNRSKDKLMKNHPGEKTYFKRKDSLTIYKSNPIVVQINEQQEIKIKNNYLEGEKHKFLGDGNDNYKNPIVPSNNKSVRAKLKKLKQNKSTNISTPKPKMPKVGKDR